MKSRTQVFLFVTLFALVVLAPLHSGWMQIAEASGYSISGRVTDGNGDSIIGVNVTTAVQLDYHVFLPLTLKTFMIVNQTPYVPSNPIPAIDAFDQSIEVDLSWSGGDPDGDAVTYDVYLEADDNTPDELLCDDVSATTCDPGTLNYSTQYFWKVIARDEHGATTSSSVWKFSTVEPSSPLFESVLYLAGLFSRTAVPDNESLHLGNEDEEDFTLETFFYVSDLDDEGPLSLFWKQYSFSMLINFHSDTPDIIRAYLTTYHVPPNHEEYELSSQLDITVGWHHIAFVWDNEFSETVDALSIYYDGVRIANSNDALPYPGPIEMTPGLFTSSQDLVVGMSMESYFEEARISDIVRYYGDTYTVPTEPLKPDANTRALWHFDDPEGSTLFEDASSYDNDLTGYEGAQTYTFP